MLQSIIQVKNIFYLQRLHDQTFVFCILLDNQQSEYKLYAM